MRLSIRTGTEEVFPMKNSTKRWASWALTLALALALVLGMCMTAYAADHTHDGVTFTEWTSADSLPTSAGDYCLTTDVTLSSTWTVPGDTVGLCLGEYTIQLASDASGSVISVPSSAALKLYADGTGGYITGGSGNDYLGGGVYVGGTFELYGGTISGNTATQGGGVYVEGTFELYGGTIADNKAVQGGGVYVRNGTFHLYDGQIQNNTNEAIGSAPSNFYGGGVRLYDGTFIMDGGEISGNSSTNGGGVCITGTSDDSTAFTMTGGSITGNTVSGSSNGGGVYVGSCAAFTMDNGSITGNACTGTTYSSSASVDMVNGGGVYVSSGKFVMNGGTISGNTAARGGGVYYDNYFHKSSTLTSAAFNGGSIINNAIKTTSSNFYGGGIFASAGISMNGDVTISGNLRDCTVNDNNETSGGSPSQLYLSSSTTVSIGSSFAPTVPIGVRMEKLGVITSGASFTEDNVSNYFTSENDGSDVTAFNGQAAMGGVSYLEYNTTTGEFEEKFCYSYNTGFNSALQRGWYVVKDDTSASKVVCNGSATNVNIILCDGKTLTCGGFIFNGSTTTLNIYAQSDGPNAGKLISNAVNGPETISAGIGGYRTYNYTGTGVFQNKRTKK